MLGSLSDVGEAEAIAVCLLFAFRDASHERRSPPSSGGASPGVHVVASHEVAPEFREYERASTTAADAYLAPIAARYLRGLGAAAVEAGLPEPVVMLSSGGVLPAEEAAAHPARLLVSGPAGGVVGAGLLARRAGFKDAIAFDMGGTSTDVCLLPGGGRCACPSARSAGCRSISVGRRAHGRRGRWLAGAGATRAGRAGRPESAGADPGPACYGRVAVRR